ncbi:MAG: glucosidase, partial [Acidimicrobiia bacterium]|nr:glucosidase [Acidimicrobiia bacterium]
VTYAKQAHDDLLVVIRVTNRGPDRSSCHVLPTLWFRNTWSWGYPHGPMGDVPARPVMSRQDADAGVPTVRAEHPVLGTYRLFADAAEALWFTENETNRDRLWGTPNPTPYVKDAFHRKLIDGEDGAVNPAETGTKAAAVYRLDLAAGETATVRLRLNRTIPHDPFAGFDAIVEQRRREADEFYAALRPKGLSAVQRLTQRQALAGMIWSKQLYYYDVEQWLAGDPVEPSPAPVRRRGRNHQWQHLNNFDIISMPDGWEYPWYAVWDLAFHCIPLARIDPGFAKGQLELVTREWYMHPNGQLPAYEWEFGDVNPPVHAWAARRVYEIDAASSGTPDIAFLERVFHKLLLNFTWWVNRKDADGNNVFQGGFLGLDNISLFDRSAPLPGGGRLDQSDGTAWMAFFTLEMLAISLELARTNPVYQSLATKFFEHFLSIATAMSSEDHCLWDPDDEFFYDVLRLPDGRTMPLRVRSVVGLIPLLAVTVIGEDTMESMPEFTERMHWFLDHRPHLSDNVAHIDQPGSGHRHLAAILTPERLRAVLGYLLDEEEFLSPYGIRSLSRYHRDHPYETQIDGQEFRVSYDPAESTTGLFGGNSNWRGPVWFPLNFLIIEALERFDDYCDDAVKVECPTGSGVEMTLREVAGELSRRLTSIFLPDATGRRPFHGPESIFESDPHWEDLTWFHEYFHGDDGTGLGASHQTGWTGLVAELLGRDAHVKEDR